MSGGVTVWGGGVLKTWATRTAIVALSSGEVEVDPAGKAAVEVFAVLSVLSDLEMNSPAVSVVDASLAQGFASKQGIGRGRHLDVRFLWLQQAFRSGALRLSKSWGSRKT